MVSVLSMIVCVKKFGYSILLFMRVSVRVCCHCPCAVKGALTVFELQINEFQTDYQSRCYSFNVFFRSFLQSALKALCDEKETLM